MATVPDITAKAVGDDVTAAWADEIDTAVSFFVANRPILHLVQQSAQTGWTTTTYTAVTFGTSSETVDRDAAHSTSSNTSRVVIGNTLGWYRVSGIYCSPGNTNTIAIGAAIYLNGSAVMGSAVRHYQSSSSNTFTAEVPPILIQATSSSDYVELMGYQNASAGTIGTNVSSPMASSLTVEWVGS